MDLYFVKSFVVPEAGEQKIPHLSRRDKRHFHINTHTQKMICSAGKNLKKKNSILKFWFDDELCKCTYLPQDACGT